MILLVKEELNKYVCFYNLTKLYEHEIVVAKAGLCEVKKNKSDE